jgi:hypothetical protein
MIDAIPPMWLPSPEANSTSFCGIRITQISGFGDKDFGKAKSKTRIVMNLETIRSFNGSEITQFMYESPILRTAARHHARLLPNAADWFGNYSPPMPISVKQDNPKFSYIQDRFYTVWIRIRYINRFRTMLASCYNSVLRSYYRVPTVYIHHCENIDRIELWCRTRVTCIAVSAAEPSRPHFRWSRIDGDISTDGGYMGQRGRRA